MKVQLVSKVNVELWDQRVNLVDPVQWVPLDLWVLGECQEREDAQERVGHRVHVVFKEMLANQVQWVHWD